MRAVGTWTDDSTPIQFFVALPCPAPTHGQIEHRSHTAFSRSAAALKTAEIVLAQQWFGGATHSIGVQAAVEVMPRIMAEENIAHRAVVNHVAITLAMCVADRMKSVRSFYGIQHGDIVRQVGIQSANKNVWRQR